ncbi:unnamed protein product [Microthlaspi erraticum]|uniref:Uncharacterized protein n=1 Tax=Microthlaspi erraticum TaxID=1685480 RepID=A0A6D2I4C8_9BRAS|nr:unnamed protein product [Microthlaspi erraticum]CAA7023332.1 unnamed protein product [Microthlaspi erraticum]
MEKNSHGELDVLERQKLRKSMGDLKAGASNILLCVSQLKLVEAYNEKSIAQYEQAPTLFSSLGLKLEIISGYFF